MPHLHAKLFDAGDGCTCTLKLSVDDAQRILDLADQPVRTIALLPSIGGQAHRNLSQLVVTYLGAHGKGSIYANYRIVCTQLIDTLDARDFLPDSDT